MNLSGWYRALREYLATPKGNFDFWDYARALFLIILTCILTALLLYWGGA